MKRQWPRTARRSACDPVMLSAYKSLGMLLYRLNRSEEAAELFRD